MSVDLNPNPTPTRFLSAEQVAAIQAVAFHHLL
jgi:hypothetical protein